MNQDVNMHIKAHHQQVCKPLTWCGHEPTCMSLDNVTLLISIGLGVKAGAPSKDNCGGEDIMYNE